MNNLCKTNDSDMSPFMTTLAFDQNGDETVYDVNSDQLLDRLTKSISIRDGSSSQSNTRLFSAESIIQKAADNFFQLADDEITSLSGKFTSNNMRTILNTECSANWRFSTQHSVASMVADDYGIEKLSDIDCCSELKLLLEKLVNLTPLQNATLIDVCERFWRLKSSNSISQTFKSMGLVLAE